MIKKINLLFITFFSVGKIKFVPGTFASLLTCILFFLLIDKLGFVILFFLTLLIFFYSFIAINNTFEIFNTEDPHEIVIDEVVGQMLPLLAIPIYETLFIAPVEYYCVSAFLLFRLFDIWKPFPISYVDNNIKGALGIILDDVLAGIYTTIILMLIFFFIGG